MICDFVCNVCGKQFKSQKTLTQHNRDVHIEEDIPCSLCDKTFRTKKHLANHKFSQHTEKESLQCDIKSDDTEYSYHTNLKLDALLRFTSLEPTCWMQSNKQAKRFTMRVTKFWNRHIIESMHLKGVMAISALLFFVMFSCAPLNNYK